MIPSIILYSQHQLTTPSMEIAAVKYQLLTALIPLAMKAYSRRKIEMYNVMKVWLQKQVMHKHKERCLFGLADYAWRTQHKIFINTRASEQRTVTCMRNSIKSKVCRKMHPHLSSKTTSSKSNLLCKCMRLAYLPHFGQLYMYIQTWKQFYKTA